MKKLALLLISIFAINTMIQANNGIGKETIITLADGTEISVGEIRKDDLLLTLNEDGTSVVVSRVADIQKSTVAELVKVTLANGAQIIVTPNHPLLSNRGWASYNSKATKMLADYAALKVHSYRVDSFLYALSPNIKIEVLPIIEIETISESTSVYKLILDTAAAYIANGIFIGQ